MLFFRPVLVFGGPLIASFADASFIDPYPISDCSAGIGFGYAPCPDQSGCCAGGAVCCAGGCCPLTAWCVNQGLSDEGCCPLSGTTNCGASVASFSQPPCTAGAFDPKPSVSCTSADDDWYCPLGNVCGSVYPNCIAFGDAGCSSGGSDLAPSPTRFSISGSPGVAPESIGTSTSAGDFLKTGKAVTPQQPVLGMLGTVGVLLGLVC